VTGLGFGKEEYWVKSEATTFLRFIKKKRLPF
jgi:hypothetical protein